MLVGWSTRLPDPVSRYSSGFRGVEIPGNLQKVLSPLSSGGSFHEGLPTPLQRVRLSRTTKQFDSIRFLRQPLAGSPCQIVRKQYYSPSAPLLCREFTSGDFLTIIAKSQSFSAASSMPGRISIDFISNCFPNFKGVSTPLLALRQAQGERVLKDSHHPVHGEPVEP